MKLEDRACNLCGLTHYKTLGYRDAVCFKKSKGEDAAVKIVKCKGCGLIYANPMPVYSSEDFTEIYPLGYYPASDEGSLKRFGVRYRKIGSRYVEDPLWLEYLKLVVAKDTS